MAARLLKVRLATALVFAFGIAGVFTYAHGLEEETIAGPSKLLEDPDGCPADFPIVALVKPGHPIDANGDGVICTDSKGIDFVDNDATDPVGVTRHVSGHGNFFDGGKVISQQDISFSFHGIGIDGGGDQAKGQFEFHDQTGVGPDLTVHGEVLCLTVNTNAATLVGIVTRSNDAGLPENRLVMWMTEDNGEGSNAIPDTLSRPSLLNEKPTGDCKFKKVKFAAVNIISGNIQVKEDETSGGLPTSLQEKDPTEKDSDSLGVSGHGNFFANGKKVVQDISFSFHAIGTEPDGKFANSVAKGQFEYHDQTGGGASLNVHGEVLCASVSLNAVTLIGRVTQSNDKGLPVDTLVAWGAQDNGEPGVATDMVSRLAPIGVKLPKEVCSGKVPAFDVLPVLNGNIQVR